MCHLQSHSNNLDPNDTIRDMFIDVISSLPLTPEGNLPELKLVELFTLVASELQDEYGGLANTVLKHFGIKTPADIAQIYTERLLKQAGLSLPVGETWEDVLEAARRMLHMVRPDQISFPDLSELNWAPIEP